MSGWGRASDLLQVCSDCHLGDSPHLALMNTGQADMGPSILMIGLGFSFMTCDLPGCLRVQGVLAKHQHVCRC